MAGELVQFAEFELDRAAYQLRRKGHVLRLERIPLDLLLFLVERRGQLVTREEIRNRIWGPNVFLDTESAINTAIGKLRRVLRDRPHSPRFIETVPAKGYRFIAAIEDPELQPALIPQSEITSTDHKSKMVPVSSSGERRHLTVLACDLRMNSASRTAQSDPEERWEKVADYHRAAVHAIERYGGHVGPYRGGDSMTACFGWPQAHDNNAE